MNKHFGNINKLFISLMIAGPLMACSTGAGRYSVDSQALSSTWMLVGILFGGFIIYSVIKSLFSNKNDSGKDDDNN